MPPPVTYWTGTWAPGMEAHTDFIEALRARRHGADRVLSISSGQTGRWLPRKRVWALGTAQWWFLRVLARVLERRGAVNHVFGATTTWHLLRAVGRRPTLFTVTINDGPLDLDLVRGVARVVAESGEIADGLREQGVKAEVVFPGVDLKRFVVTPPPSTGFQVLFASSPAHPDEIQARGIPELVELARNCPDIVVRCLWRPWDDEQAAVDAIRKLAPPENFEIVRGKTDMAAEVAQSHAVVVAYAAGFGKAAPQSILEGLAAGRPALLGPHCSIGAMISDANAGRVASEQSGESLAAALQDLRANYDAHALAARRLAEERFSLQAAAARYEEIYAELAAPGITP